MNEHYSSPALTDVDTDGLTLYPSQKRPASTTRRYIVLGVIICCLLVLLAALMLSTVITLSVLFSHERHEVAALRSSARSSDESSYECPSAPSPPASGPGPNYFGSLVRNTTEYQIKLVTKDWTDREALCADWVELSSHHNKYLNYDEARTSTSCREQWDLHLNECQVSDQIRCRRYYHGDEKGVFYVDTKTNSHDREVACGKPFDGATVYLLNTTQKCERDRHECVHEDKFSRETRLFFKDYIPPMETCGDNAALFTDNFADMPNHLADNLTPTYGRSFWWVREYEGYMDGDTRWKIAFTLWYREEDQAVIGDVAPHYGEWSIRLYSKGDGLIDDWNSRVVSNTESMYQALIDIYGEEEC